MLGSVGGCAHGYRFVCFVRFCFLYRELYIDPPISMLVLMVILGSLYGNLVMFYVVNVFWTVVTLSYLVVLGM